MAVWRFLSWKLPTHPDEVRMTLGEHLEELRARLIRAIAALAVGAILCLVFAQYIIAVLLWPVFTILRKHGFEPEIKAFNPAETMMTDLKVAFIVGFIISAPYSLAQVWGFVAAGLYPYERKWVHRFVPISVTLFFAGAVFLLTVVSPVLLNFLLSYRTELPDISKHMPGWLIPGGQPVPIKIEQNPIDWSAYHPMPAATQDPPHPPEYVPWINLAESEIRIRVGDTIWATGHLRKADRRNRLTPDLRIGETIPFILHLAAAFGIGFQVPVIVAFLALAGLASAETMSRARRYVWFGMSIVAAVITPPDPGSMLFLLLPMALLFEVGLLGARLVERGRSPSSSA